VAGIALDLDAVRRGTEHPLHEEPVAVRRVANDDELAGTGRARGHEQQPIAVTERGLHARARDGHPEGYFFVAQKMSLISFTAA